MLNRFSRAVLGACAVLAPALLAPSSLMAQDTGTIRGRVIEAASSRGISDVQVTGSGTTRGAVTNANGDYTIDNVRAGAYTVAVRRIGYARRTASLTVTAGSAARADFALSIAATQLDAIVTTGTAGAVEKRTVGNAITQVDAAEVSAKTNISNVTDILVGRAPGVTVAAGSGTPGTAYSGIFTDELANFHGFFENVDIDRRAVDISNGTYAGAVYTPLQSSRFIADSASAFLRHFLGDTASRDVRLARTLAYAGYSYLLMGEQLCAAPINGSAHAFTPDELLDTARVRFNAAIQVATRRKRSTTAPPRTRCSISRDWVQRAHRSTGATTQTRSPSRRPCRRRSRSSSITRSTARARTIHSSRRPGSGSSDRRSYDAGLRNSSQLAAQLQHLQRDGSGS